MPDDDRVLKEMKVRIPVSQHIKLHGIRLVTDQGISETVQKALEEYFHRAERGEPILPAPPPTPADGGPR